MASDSRGAPGGNILPGSDARTLWRSEGGRRPTLIERRYKEVFSLRLFFLFLRRWHLRVANDGIFPWKRIVR